MSTPQQTQQQQIIQPLKISHTVKKCEGGFRLEITLSGCFRGTLGLVLRQLPEIRKKGGRLSPIAWVEPRENLGKPQAAGILSALSTSDDVLELVARDITHEIKTLDAQQQLNYVQRRVIQEQQKAAQEIREQKRAEWEQRQQEREQQKLERATLGAVAKITTVVPGAPRQPRKYQARTQTGDAPIDFPSLSSAAPAPAPAAPAAPAFVITEPAMTPDTDSAWE